MKLKNIEMELLLNDIKPILSHRDKIGYIAARNTRILNEALTEYFIFKNELIKKYGEEDKDENGRDLGTVSVNQKSEKFNDFIKEFDSIKDIEHEVDLMTVSYDDVIGILNGEEILKLDRLFTE